jgi:hypothetical protein
MQCLRWSNTEMTILKENTMLQHIHRHAPKIFPGILALFVLFSLTAMLFWNADMPGLPEVGSLGWLREPCAIVALYIAVFLSADTEEYNDLGQ